MYCEDCVEVLYEYDVREMWIDWHEKWDQKRKDQYLVRQDIVKPLSVDVSVWGKNEHLFPDVHFLECQLDLSVIKNLIVTEWHIQKPYWLIAITRIEESPGIQWSQAEINPEWKLLGYDICAGPSFLMNAGWTEDEDELRAHLRPLLNEYHLFPDLEIAKANWQSIQDREPPHGPFTINGLYLIEEINTEKN